ncbi:MAG: four helix bundle protein [Bacteroidota bacterium]|uniref:Four helix bundle protein n=1 Tax=Pedobacter cryotolerans TaxID=2571270 RepID=A0A4U1BYF5_9SPHI|nr:four helix bundle protein [Pedobacter cryotolerans]TKB98071.1 four helix bundle protein [Pedobacter cryotolerans]
MAFKFEELKVWQISLLLSDEIDAATKYFPKTELFSLTTQIKKAADSVNLNIAEGCMGQSKAEFSRFLTYSVRSGLEVVSCLFMARNRNYMPIERFNYFYNEYEQLCKMINALKNSLK